MYAMQYELTLPTDYDMQIIRDRVASRGSFTDDFAGLRLKAYLIRTAGQGSEVNAYAPFYLWDDIDAMGSFLWGGRGFGGIVSDFGRPAVQTWAGVDFLRGDADPAFATKETFALQDDDNPEDAVAALRATFAQRASNGVYVSALAVDPRTWQAVIVSLTNVVSDELRGIGNFGPYDRGALTEYEVLHLSEPLNRRN
jgi:hypothetical protein